MTYAVFEDGWILHKIFDTYDEANKYKDYCKRSYQGRFSVGKIKNDNIKSYSKAIYITK